MAFIGTKSITTLLKSSDVISPFDEGRIKNGAYELSLGNQVFQTDSNPRSVKTLNEGQEIYIESGQFALLLTEEKVRIPKDKIAFISIKAGVKFQGLVNVSGFHVDPGFEGQLLFSVYNAGPSRIVLQRGKNYFPIWFAELNESQDYKGSHTGQNKIPSDPIQALSQGKLASPNALSKRIDDNQKEINTKIGLIEKEQTAKDYLVKAALGLFLVILVKLIFDWLAYDNGFKKGIELKQKEISTNCKINHLLIEKKTLLIEIDSLKKVKSEAIKQNSQATTKQIK